MFKKLSNQELNNMIALYKKSGNNGGIETNHMNSKQEKEYKQLLKRNR